MTADVGSELDDLVKRALAEDIGSGDVTTRAVVPAGTRARATISQKEPGVIFGLEAAEAAFRALDEGVTLERLAAEGEWRADGPVLAIEGEAEAILGAERTSLNLLGRLSGVATLTARCVAAVAGTGTQILDTRKTTPGLRALEKAAVRAGGGRNHRLGLDDAVLVKENHVTLTDGLAEAVHRALESGRDVEVECRTATEVDAALAAGAHRLLLDNMDLEELQASVAARDRIAAERRRPELEASGGVTLENVRKIAETGVDHISVGALTHSAPALDLSMLLEPA